MSSKLQRTVQSFVKSPFSGYSLLDYLCERFQYNSAAEWQEIIDDSRIKVNGQVASSCKALAVDDSIEYIHLDHPEPIVDKNYKVIKETESYLVVNKPGNLPVHPAGKFFHNTLWAVLKHKGYEPHFINRLDRETSGLILIALNSSAASRLGKQIQKRKIDKEYLALVEGEFPENLEAVGYLEKDPQSEISKRLIFNKGNELANYGKNGVDTSFKLEKKYKELSLIRCKIRTGRTHQIRATLNSLGFPLVGDKIYGVNEQFYLKFIHKTISEDDYSLLRMKRQALHSCYLAFRDPDTGEDVKLSCGLPEDIQKVLKSL